MSPASDDEKSAARATGRDNGEPAVQKRSAEELAGRRAAIDALLVLRDSGCVKPVTLKEIHVWRHEGHRY